MDHRAVCLCGGDPLVGREEYTNITISTYQLACRFVTHIMFMRYAAATVDINHLKYCA